MAKKNKTIVISTKPTHNGGIQLILPELEAVYAAYDQYYNKRNAGVGSELFDKTIALVDWFNKYAEEVLQGKTYTLSHLVKMLFDERELKNDAEIADNFRYQMYAEREYLQDFAGMLKVGHIDAFKEAFWDTFVNVEFIVWGVEQYIWKCPLSKVIFRFGSRTTLSVSDIHSAMHGLFYIETLSGIKDIYLRDLKPNVVFQIRQILEKIGKNIIGYSSIVDQHGKIVKKHTQVAWKFIDQKNREKNTAWKIELPIEQSVVLKVNTWANQFVHNTMIYDNYMVNLAIRVVDELLKQPSSPITTYDGVSHPFHIDYGAIKITNYDVMKADFEAYIREEDSLNTPVVQWLPYGKVGAYIMSLGTVAPKVEVCGFMKCIKELLSKLNVYFG